jgi:hypothetical protein
LNIAKRAYHKTQFLAVAAKSVPDVRDEGVKGNTVHLSPQEGDGTQEAQKAQEKHPFSVPFVLLVFRPLSSAG